MRKVKYLIIGAGVSGLGFANFINDNDYIILEKENEPGGYCRTIYKDEFVWDYAGHFFHFANRTLKEFFNSKIDDKDLICKEKNTKIYYKDNLIDYPFQKNIHQLPKDEFIDCLYDLFNKNEKEHYLGFEDMLYGKFGKSITEMFLKPYNEKLYACNLNDLDSSAMGRFFPYANIKEIINNMKLEEDNSYNKEFLYPKRGAITYINALLMGIKTENILYNNEVINIDINNKVVETSTALYKYDYLINTAPLDELIKFVDFKEYENNKDKLTFNKVLVFNLGFDKKSQIKDVHWIYIPDKDINFYRIGFYDNILNQDKLSMYIEIGYSSDAEINIENELEEILKNLKKMNVIDDHKLIAYSNIIMKPAYVHISKEGDMIKEKKKKEFETNNIFTIGRYGDWKYCSIEDSMIDAIELAKKLNKEYL